MWTGGRYSLILSLIVLKLCLLPHIKVNLKMTLYTPCRHVGGVANITPCVLYCWGKNLQYPLNRRLDEFQSWHGCFGDERNLLLLAGFEPKIVQPIAYSPY